MKIEPSKDWFKRFIMKLNKNQRKQLHQKYKGRCAYCGIVLHKVWHVDHLEPVIRIGGKIHNPDADTIDNLMPSCPQCNRHKNSLSLEKWREILEDLPDNLERNNNIYRHALRFQLIKPIKKRVIFYFEAISS